MQVHRTENKFIISLAEARQLMARLDQIMPRDIHSLGPDGYEIRSLYFDTLGDRSCVEKADGLQVHEKIRARIYGTDDTVIKLESKYKNGEHQTKKTMLISRPLMEELAQGEYSGLLSSDDPMAPYFYKKLSGAMQPRSIVQYRRVSFNLDTNNTRITFDYDIRTTECCFDLFQEPLLACPILPPDKVVLEVKFNNFLLGYIQRALQGIRRSPVSYSKYFIGRRFCRTM